MNLLRAIQKFQLFVILELRKIMVVDDNASFRRLIVSALKNLAGEFVECDHGERAMAYYESHLPEFVIMDLEMEGTDGMTATRLIKSRFPHARILILSQHEDADLRLEAEAAGACGYVVKDDLFKVRQFIETQIKS